MQLLIHDLSAEQWNEIAQNYPDSTVLCDSGAMKPCVGCFGCWNKTPGECVIKDGYDNMGYLIHHADEVTVISRYTYGGFSGSVKNFFDRSLAYVLPQFEIINGESHHQKRYEEEKPYTFIFHGPVLSEEEKENARRYVKAVTANMRTVIKDIIFWETEDRQESRTDINKACIGKTVLLNASMRSVNGNTAKLTEQLAKQLKEETEIINLSQYINRYSVLVNKLEDVSTLVLCEPLYVDGLPSQLIRLLEAFQREYKGGVKKIYVLSNMGLYESQQLINLFSAVRKWSEVMKFEYCGGLGIGAGELVGGLLEFLKFGKGPMIKINDGMKKLAEAINNKQKTEDLYKEVYLFPRSLYIAIANSGWKRMAKKNGLTEQDLYRRL